MSPAAGPVDGLLVVDKPAGMTSHDVVARCRRVLGQRRVGHAGTLDPDATGLMLLGLGQGTRLLQFLSGLPKRYTAEVVLGVATSTLDASGTVTGTWDMHHVTVDDARRAARGLTGDILQVPPMVSALKVGGRRLHELARMGVEVERSPRPVTVTRFDVDVSSRLTEGGPNGCTLAIDVECSSGTYVRSLAADLGSSLGGGAHLRSLRRLAVGAFSIDEAQTLSELENGPNVLPPLEAVRGMCRATVGEDLAGVIANGAVLGIDVLREAGATGPGPWAVVNSCGVLIAVYQAHKPGRAKPLVVLHL